MYNSIIKVGSRKSSLAKLQSYLVVDALKRINPSLQFDFIFKETLGDEDLKSPLWKMASKGVFTQDFKKDLIEKKIDFVVHSWKDVEIEEDKRTKYLSVLTREDSRDILFFKKNSLKNHQNFQTIHIYSSSPRRAYNVPPFLRKALPKKLQNKKILFEVIRGNIQTRLSKWISSDYQGIILAKAAIDRLLKNNFSHSHKQEYITIKKYIQECLKKSLFMCLPLSENPTLPAQGGLVVEFLKENKMIENIIKTINIPEVQSLIDEERKILKSYGGGCHQKIGVSCIQNQLGKITYIRGEKEDQNQLQKIQWTQNITPPKPISLKKCWPLSREDTLKFKRINMDIQLPERHLWVSRSNAWLSNWKQKNYEFLIWTAGTKTWFDLADKDVWVSGTADSLGENEPHCLEQILNQENPLFLKVTHNKSKNINSKLERIVTYQLQISEEIPECIRSKTHFFWMSAYQFDLVFEKYPEIIDGYHFCGLGLTYKHIRKRIDKKNLFPFLNYKEWKKFIRGGNFEEIA